MSAYTRKDKAKFSICTHLQSYGCVGSSSRKYNEYGVEGLPHLDLSMGFDSTSIVGISTNGHRPCRVIFPTSVLKLLSLRKCKVVTDNRYHRNRFYNIGEREVAHYLTQLGYTEHNSEERSIWHPPTN